VNKVDSVRKDIDKFFSDDNKSIPDELKLVKSTSVTIGQAFM
jgi:hypothetical protein